MSDLRRRVVELAQWAAQQERDLLAPYRGQAQPATADSWTADDASWHLACWRRYAAQALAEICAGGEPVAYGEGLDDRNAQYLAQGRDMTSDEISSSSAESLSELEAGLERAPAECIERELKAPGRDGQRAWELVVGNAVGHVVWHVASFLVEAGDGRRGFDLYAGAESRVRSLPSQRFWLEDRYNLACLHARAGQPEQALGILREVFTDAPVLRTLAPKDPDLEPLRQMPGFQELVGA